MNRYSLVVQKTNARIKSNLSLVDAKQVVVAVKEKRDVKLNIVAQPFKQEIEGNEEYLKTKEQYLVLGEEAKAYYGDILEQPKKEQQGWLGKVFGGFFGS